MSTIETRTLFLKSYSHIVGFIGCRIILPGRWCFFFNKRDFPSFAKTFDSRLKRHKTAFTLRYTNLDYQNVLLKFRFGCLLREINDGVFTLFPIFFFVVFLWINTCKLKNGLYIQFFYFILAKEGTSRQFLCCFFILFVLYHYNKKPRSSRSVDKAV